MKYHFDIKQNSEEWDAIRLGRITASKAADLLMDDKCAGYIKMINKIAEERFTGESCESDKFTGNWATERGHTFEPVARRDYEMKSFDDVDLVGFVSVGSWLGCSPDGLIDKSKAIQIKCPIFSTQNKYLGLVRKHKLLSDNEIIKKLDGTYYKQMQFELFICKDRIENIFYSYHPKLHHIQLKMVRDIKMQSEIRYNVRKAIKQINQLIKGYKGV